MDSYQENRINRAMIVLEEAMKVVYAAHAEAGHELREPRSAISEMGGQMYAMKREEKKAAKNA